MILERGQRILFRERKWYGFILLFLPPIKRGIALRPPQIDIGTLKISKIPLYKTLNR